MGSRREALLRLQKLVGKKEAKKLARRIRFPKARDGELDELDSTKKEKDAQKLQETSPEVLVAIFGEKERHSKKVQVLQNQV